jgi:hypothetical protein
MKHVPEITLDNLKSLGVETLAQLVFESYPLNSALEARIKRLLAATTSPTALIALIKQQLTHLSTEKKFYFARESHALADRLNETRKTITEDLADQDVEAAIELSWRFLALHRKIFERVDDSYGNISPIFELALKHLAQLYLQMGAYDEQQLAKDLFQEYSRNGYGVYDRAIHYFAPALKSPGLCQFEDLLRQPIEGNSSTRSTHAVDRYHSIAGLLAIADARQDVDAYIAVIQQYESSVSSSRALEIAQRLIQAQRYSEALDSLASVENIGRFGEARRQLEVQALEALGQRTQAQALRVEGFKRRPSKPVYEACLVHAEHSERLKEDLLDAVMTNTSFTDSLSFLIDVHELERAAELVREHESHWDGRHYTALLPTAQALEKRFPLESSILYRALIHDILTRAQSKYYHHAVRYLAVLEQLSAQINNWNQLLDHHQYFSTLREQHKRKTAFWKQYQK